jgi:hypothetical protein
VTLLPKAPIALLRFDAIQIQRPSSSGGINPVVTYTQIYDGRGALGAPTQQEYTYGPETDRVVVVDQPMALELGVDVQANDRVVTPRGTFTVISVAAHRLHQRALMRKVS